MSNEEKISKIKDERKAMLESLKASLEASSSETIDTLSEIKEVIDKDEKSCKEYKAIKDAQNMILKFMQRIANAKEVDDIMDDREIVNYYINKIKRILNSRGVNSTEIDRLSSKVSGLRKGISGYIRFLKREKNIKRIDVLNKKSIKSLSEDEKEELKTLLKNEMAYAKRNSRKNQKEEIETSLDESEAAIEEPSVEETSAEQKDMAESSKTDQTNESQSKDDVCDPELEEIKAMIEYQSTGNYQDSDDVYDPELEEIKSMIGYQSSGTYQDSGLSTDQLLEDARCIIGGAGSIDELIAKLRSSKKNESGQLNLIDSKQEEYESFLEFFESHDEKATELYEYGNSTLKNFILFFKNIPICYMAKNNDVCDAKMGWLNFHKDDVHKAYYLYSKEKYSIIHELSRMLKSSKLSKRESKCLEEHSECSMWIAGYLHHRDLRLSRTHN